MAPVSEEGEGELVDFGIVLLVDGAPDIPGYPSARA